MSNDLRIQSEVNYKPVFILLHNQCVLKRQIKDFSKHY